MDNFQSIIDALSDVVFVHHPVTGKIEYINKTCFDYYQYSAEELMTQGLQLIEASGDKFDFKKQLELIEQAAKGKVFTFEWLTKKADGTEFWVEVTLKRAFVNDEIKVVATVRDISSLKKVLKAYTDREFLLESINRNITDGIFRTVPNGNFLYINNALVNMFGYNSVEEMMGTDPQIMYADSSYRSEITAELLISSELKNIVVKYRKKDGSSFWGATSATLSLDSNDQKVADGVLKDITKEKENEEALKLVNEELLDKNFELDQLIYKTSHDLRSPLRSVLGLTNLMKVEGPENQAEFIDRIDDRILKMDEFIKSMLNYSRTSRLELKQEVIDFPELLANCSAELEYIDGFTEFKIIPMYKGDLSLAKIDRLRLSIICCNLISNAFKYRNTELTNSYLHINIEIKSGFLHIEFEDNGIGIAEENIEKVFEMFFRATVKADGSGLGMYIVKQAVTKLNGEIYIKSALKKGTKTFIKIPINY